jgi:predicted membrane channel-forming protein YqfA (hemolysin III family)
MWTALRRFWHYFLLGFLIVFVVYLYFRLDQGELIVGLLLGAAGGLVLSLGIFALERRFPERPPPQ